MRVISIILFISLLAIASYTDIKKREIPNSISVTIGVLSLLNFHIFGILAALPFFIAAVLEPNKMGGGDIKLTAAVGLYLGFFQTLLGAVLGLALSLIFYVLSGRKNKAMPLAPFLSIGFVVTMLGGFI